MLKEYQKKMIFMLVQQKLLTAELYTTIAGHFPDHKDFWHTLSADELDYASWLEYLFKKAEEGDIEFHEKRLTTYTIKVFHEYLQNAITGMKEEKPTLSRAVSLTLHIERSLIEKRMFEHFAGYDKDLSAVLRTLRRNMLAHSERGERAAALLPGAHRRA